MNADDALRLYDCSWKEQLTFSQQLQLIESRCYTLRFMMTPESNFSAVLVIDISHPEPTKEQVQAFLDEAFKPLHGTLAFYKTEVIEPCRVFPMYTIKAQLSLKT